MNDVVVDPAFPVVGVVGAATQGFMDGYELALGMRFCVGKNLQVALSLDGGSFVAGLVADARWISSDIRSECRKPSLA